MWSKPYSINIVTTEYSWFEKYAIEIVEHLNNLVLDCKILYSHQQVEENSIAFYLSYTKIVPENFIKKTFQSLVVHASELPKGKGFSPWVWQILEGKNNIPVCLFQMDKELDAGDIFDMKYLFLQGFELLEEIRVALAGLIKELIIEYLQKTEKPIGIKQVGESTFYRKRNILDSELDVSKCIAEQFNLLRIVDNESYPAFFKFQNKKYTIKIERVND